MMETTSPKVCDNAPSKTTPTNANGKKLVQARLPFKTLGGGGAAADATTAAMPVPALVEKRKRKLSNAEVDERAAKLNRIDGNSVADDLLSTEILDESVEYAMTDRKSNIKSEVKSLKSESKENVNINERKQSDSDDGNDTDGVLVLDDSSGDLSDGIDLAEPKAKKCLDMNDDRRRSKRINDEKLITIKLPMVKKTKEATKKAKKVDKVSNDEKPAEVEISLVEDADDEAASETNVDGTSTAVTESERSTVVDDSAIHTPTSDKGLTPKQAARRAESEKKLLEKQRAKEERERERQREKEERELQKKLEKEAKEEQRKREKEAKDQKRLAEIEEKEKKRQADIEEREKKRQAEIEAKNEERRKKEEQREEERRKREEQKEEERKRREDEKRQREEAEVNKNRKTAEAFAKFFVPKKGGAKAITAESADKDVPAQLQPFMSFQVKGDMKVAAVTRRQLSQQQRTNLESALFTNVDKAGLYLTELKKGERVAQRSGKTWSSIDEGAQSEVEDEVFFVGANGLQVIDEKPKKQIYRVKYFHFHENRRPPYHGTWRKRTKTVGPRRPLAQDKNVFDYEVDSDDEWEEEEPGESLHGSDDEKDEESEDDYVIDNEFFVPHGHLSDEELNGEEELDDESNLETQQAKLKFIQEAFDNEIHRKTEKLKPRVIGLIWQQADRTQPANCSKATWDLLKANSYMMIGESLSMTPPHTADDNTSGDDDIDTSKNSARRLKITERDVPNLIRLINGNQNNCNFLIKEFRAFSAKTQSQIREFSIKSIKNKIKELAKYGMCPEPGPMHNKMCWYVPLETRQRYALEEPMPNTWQYTLTPRRAPIDAGNVVGVAGANAVDAHKDKLKEPAQCDSDADSDVIDLSDSNSCGLSESVTSETVKHASSKPANFNIAKFIRVLSEDEKKKQFDSFTLRGSSSEFEPIAGSSRSQTPPISSGPKKANGKPTTDTQSKPNVAKKRVRLLASGPCGQDFSPKLKETLVTQFVTQSNNLRKRKWPNDGQAPVASTAGTSDGLIQSTNSAQGAADIIVIE